MKNFLLFDFGGVKYGVVEEDINEVREEGPLHRLPLSHRCLAGLAIVDDRTVMLADLAACVGLSPLTGARKGLFLLIDTNEKIAGFAVSAAMERIEASLEHIRALPAYVKNDIVDTGLIHQSRIVPLINLPKLHERIQKGMLEPSHAAFSIPASLPFEPSSCEAVWIFSAGGQQFAVPADSVRPVATVPESLSPLVPAPSHVRGLLFQDGDVLPVIDTASLLGLPGEHAKKAMLTADIGGSPYGLLVGADHGFAWGPSFRTQPLPPLCRSSWMPCAVAAPETVIPVLDVASLLASDGTADVQESLAERYTPSSTFSSRFGKESVEIIEFSLLGSRHALPKEEVTDVLPLLPYRPLPNVLPIVAGVAEHGGELHPVLDLAMIFRRRSPVTGSWRMLRVQNGDFRAIVVTEEVIGERTIPVEAQRPVPFALPHQVVYGCYLDTGVVSLVLNVEALAVHFDQRMAATFVDIMPKEVVEASAAAPAVPVMTSDALSGIVSESAEESEPALQTDASVADEATETLPETSVADSSTVLEQAQAAVGPEADGESAVQAGAEPQSGEEITAQDDTAAAALEEASAQAEEAARMRAEEEERARSEADALARAQEARRRHEEEERRKAEEAEARARTEAAERARLEEERRARAEEERRRFEEEERQRAEAEAGAKGEEEEKARARAVEQVIEEPEALSQKAEAPRQAYEEPVAAGTSAPPVQDVPSGQTQRTNATRQEERVSPKKVLISLAAAAVLAMLLYLGTGTDQQPVVPDAGSRAEVYETKAEGPATEAPLVLKVAPHVPIPGPTVYIVVHGDTLWAISERFTGDPFNYPRVARDNSIATPDLIFPGQKILLTK
jgi:chemotaxis signal transduction protein/nucleoid-associated protein YgaU